MPKTPEEAENLLRRLCRVKKKRWVLAPWKLVRKPDESDQEYKLRSEAEAATHGYSAWGQLHQFDHKPWSGERADQATPQWIGVRRASPVSRTAANFARQGDGAAREVAI